MTDSPAVEAANETQISYGECLAREAEARGDHAGAARWRRIQAAVDLAPPLTDQQKASLRVLLAPAVAGARTA
ncbi:hypothetical protein [Kitasatospora sp. A2-31]|uniref:hypothetical protein n=1 Tax=Kitasatospora sp. A2-31 TaxID=2916414 RepID=UPI001EEB09B9|nr:hypothetical protein [Kitasatospora sp. A2-31]MCG6497644.1 hypothetical protein [Kitasatospora sp. A2-31]